MLVSLEGVSREYRLGDQTIHALRDVNLSIDEGVFMAVAGPSGSGKSTLLNLIGCIDEPTSGRIEIDGKEVSGRTPDQLADYRARSLGFVFQTFNLFPVLTAAENVEFPLLQVGELTRSQRRERVERYLEFVGLSRFARRRPNQLSGGQRQRVAIARALAVHPRIVLADEPTANLDHATGTEVIRLMQAINEKFGTTFIFSTHDARVMAAANRLVLMEDGRIVKLGIRRGTQWIMVRQRQGGAEVAATPEAPVTQPAHTIVVVDGDEPMEGST